MKRKYREAMRAAASRPWDTYVDGQEDDALETQDWYDGATPHYEPGQSTKSGYDPEQELPF